MPANVNWHSPEQLRLAARREILPTDVVLDLGSGIMPQSLFVPRIHICCEPFPLYLKRLQEKTFPLRHRFVYLNMDWKGAVRVMPPASVDTVMLIDVIEHLDKEEGRKLIEPIMALARRQVLISTPLGFCPQHFGDREMDSWGMDGGAWQEHRSGWEPMDFDDRWTIHACREYHQINGRGEKLDPPVGMFWAIHNVIPPPKKVSLRRLRLALTCAFREFRERMGHHSVLDL